MHLNQLLTKTDLFFGQVQQTHGVTLTLQVGSYSVEGFVELSLDVRQLLKHLTGWPEQHLEPHKAATFPAQHEPWFWQRNWWKYFVIRCIHSLYLTPPGLHVEHVGCVMLQADDLGKSHVLVEKLLKKKTFLQNWSRQIGTIHNTVKENVKTFPQAKIWTV